MQPRPLCVVDVPAHRETVAQHQLGKDVDPIRRKANSSSPIVAPKRSRTVMIQLTTIGLTGRHGDVLGEGTCYGRYRFHGLKVRRAFEPHRFVPNDVVVGDMTDAGAVDEALAGCDRVVHTAA
jgi:hypothetical protein